MLYNAYVHCLHNHILFLHYQVLLLAIFFACIMRSPFDDDGQVIEADTDEIFATIPPKCDDGKTFSAQE